MKKYKIFILAIVALIFAFFCFTGFVSAPSALAQPFDDLFPPQSSDYYYFYFDFSTCGIPINTLNTIFLSITFYAYNPDLDGHQGVWSIEPINVLGSQSFVYQASLEKAFILTSDIREITFTFLFPELTSYGIPSIDSIVTYDTLDVSFDSLVFFGSNFFSFEIIPSNMSSTVVTFGNTELALKSQYNSLQSQYNTLNSQYTTLQGQYNTLNSQYTTLQGQYSTLNSQYTTLQGEYEYLENLYEEARDNADHYQGLLREANAEIDELSADNDRLQGIINNLPPTDLAFGWVGSAFATVDNILSIEIIPNLTIGSLVLIPLVLGVLFFVLRLVRGE